MDNYISQCRMLSLTARMAIALLVFERFCKERQLEGRLLVEFSDHLWKWPLIDGPDQFDPWEKSRPELVNFGLGDEASNELASVLESASLEESEFRQIVEGVVEILWASFWGAAEDELSIQALQTVIKRSNMSHLPSLTPFKFSRFSDGNGWGEKISLQDCEFWRKCGNCA